MKSKIIILNTDYKTRTVLVGMIQHRIRNLTATLAFNNKSVKAWDNAIIIPFASYTTSTYATHTVYYDYYY